MAVKQELSRYADEVLLRKINLDISEDAIETMSSMMGYNVLEPTPEARILESERWLESDTKRQRERMIGLMAICFGGNLLARFARSRIQKFDGQDGHVRIKQGFLDLEGPKRTPTYETEKVRTMERGADGMLSSPFEATTFQAGHVVKDERILPTKWATLFRRTGIDEVPQITKQVARGEMQFVGLRGYTQMEILGTQLLIELVRSELVPVPDLTRQVFLRYQEVISRYKPIPAFAGILQAYKAKDTPHSERMFSDILYLEGANRRLDNLIIGRSIVNRVKGTGAR